jgi:hypothetical protein
MYYGTKLNQKQVHSPSNRLFQPPPWPLGSCQLHESHAGVDTVYSLAEYVIILKCYGTLKLSDAVCEAFSNEYHNKKV